MSVAKEHERSTAEASQRLSNIAVASRPNARKRLGINSGDIARAVELLRKDPDWSRVRAELALEIDGAVLDGWKDELIRLAAEGDQPRKADGPQVAGAPRWPK